MSPDDQPPPRAPLGSNTVGEVRGRSAGTINGADEVHIGDRHDYAPAPAAPASAPPSDLLPRPAPRRVARARYSCSRPVVRVVIEAPGGFERSPGP